MKLINQTRKEEYNNGSLKAYLVAAPADLRKVLGAPQECDGYKVSGEYVLDLQGETGRAIRIGLYDWKCTSLYDPDYPSPVRFWNSKEPQTFNLGGTEEFTREVLEHLVHALAYAGVQVHTYNYNKWL